MHGNPRWCSVMGSLFQSPLTEQDDLRRDLQRVTSLPLGASMRLNIRLDSAGGQEKCTRELFSWTPTLAAVAWIATGFDSRCTPFNSTGLSQAIALASRAIRTVPCAPQKFTPRWVRAGSGDAGRRDARWQRRDAWRVCDVRSVPFGASGHREVQGPTQNVVVHRCNGTSTPRESTVDAVR